MGVTGLWKLIEPCGRPVPVETLEGKILAVDVSIWLHQVVKGFQDSKGSALPNAHLLGLFHRLCKLLYYRVRPVFVFDGCVPQLKQDTIVRRQQQRSKLNSETERIQALLLQSLANEKVVQQALGANAAELLLKSPSKRPSKQLRGEKEMDDLFKLPELPSTSTAAQGCGVADEVQRRCDENNDGNDASFASESGSAGSADSSFEESSPWNAYNTNLQAIDVRSQHFRNLPAEVRHDILVDIKETRKQSSWGRLHELPSRSDDFSSFQMKRLLKRRAVQESLEEAEQEMGGCALTYTELRDLFTEEGIIEPSAMEKNSKQICSDENTRFLLVRDLKKKLSEVEEKPKMKLEDVKAESTPSQGEADREDAKDVKAEDELGNEYDADLQLAMALSLEDPVKVYSNEDYEYESNENLRLNREQRKQLKNAAIGPARAYMIEYGGMNDDEVMGIMDKTQVTLDEDLANVETTLSTVVASEVKKNSDITTTTTSSTERLTSPKIDESDDTEIISNNCLSQENESLRLHVTDDSETDSDFEDVPEEETIIASQIKSKIAIVLDVKSPLAPEDDLFADIFEAKTEVTIVNEDTPLADDEANNIRSENSTEECKTIVKDCLQVKSSKDCKSIGQLNDSKLTADDGKASKEPSENSLLLDKANVLDESMSGDTRHEIVTATEEPCKALLDPGKVTTLSSILDELKKKAEEVKKINLDDVSIVEKGVIEISDDEPAHNSDLPTQTGKTEFIEIVDSDEGDRVPRKSPNLNTPSKNKSIIEYFETKYVVVRTPEKEGEESVPKVKSPFFVKKSPRSGGKRSTEKRGDSPTPAKKACKASKSLFYSEAVATGEDSTLSKEVALNAEDVMQEAARILKSQKNTEELKTLAADLAQERKDLESERNRQDRMGMSISQRMSSDCQQLLRLFGIPYIVAPMEAEAQCAFLDAVELTNGTITDDSDIWLFGGRTVYKNFFEQNKHVLEYHAERIKETFKCDRKKLIQLACLVGSDYTTGVHGIGTVTGLEILASFSSVKETDEIGSEQSATAVLSTLCRFRDWWQLQKSTAMPPGSTVRLNLRKKLKNIELSEGFPSSAVIEAYLRPKVDDNRDPFKWGCPDVESIREFTRKTFGWTTKKTDDILMPVMKRVNEKRTQASIRNYFTTKGALLVREPKVSKRVQKAIETLTGQAADSVEAAKPMTRKRAKRKQTTSTECDDAAGSALGVVPSTSGARAQVAQRRARIPDTKQVIPQRERNLELMQRNKEKAAALLRGAKSKMAN